VWDGTGLAKIFLIIQINIEETIIGFSGRITLLHSRTHSSTSAIRCSSRIASHILILICRRI